MQRYRFADNFDAGPTAPRWPDILRRAHAAKIRPTCLCRTTEPVAMYIAIVPNGHALKRMPNTGPRHASFCDHYEAPAQLSGLGQVAGSAIREDPEHATTSLSLDFSLSKGRPRAPSEGEPVEHDSVRSDGKKLTLRATLHFLLDQANLTRWTPAMAGKRSWFVVRRELLAAASHVQTKGMAFTDVLFIPESFSSQHADAIRARRITALARLNAKPAARMIVVAEVKSIDPTPFGHHQMVLKHMSDMPLRLGDDLNKSLRSRFEYQLAMRAQIEHSMLLMIGTFSQPMPGIFDLETCCLINVNEGFLPFESVLENELLNALFHRRFTKGLRFNLKASTPIASAILHDTPKPTALYLIPPDADEAAVAGFASLAASSPDTVEWTWNSRDVALPPLPPAGYGGGASAASIGTAEPAPLASGSVDTPEAALERANAHAQEAGSVADDLEVDAADDPAFEEGAAR